MLFGGFPTPAPEPQPEQSTADRRRAALERRRAKVAAHIERGFHPLLLDGPHMPLLGVDRDGAGHTCGDCVHRVLKRLGGTYPKCDLGPVTGGPATDVLARWPACYRWEGKG